MVGKKILGMNDLKDFEVTAEIEEKKGKKKFSLTISARNANYAAEKVLCIIGSKHKKSRRKIVVKEVKEQAKR